MDNIESCGGLLDRSVFKSFVYVLKYKVLLGYRMLTVLCVCDNAGLYRYIV